MFKPWFGRLRQQVAYNVVYGITEVRERGFYTAGYWPPLPTLQEVPALARARAQANLYEFALRAHPALQRAPRTVLDIGCGAGGGLAYAHAIYPQARLVGVDQNAPALKAAWTRLERAPALELRLAPGDRTRLPPHCADLIVAIGTVNAVGPSELLNECARVLAPGGVVSLTAMYRRSPEQVAELFAAAAEQAGLVLRSVTDITPGTRAALEHDRPWIEAVIGKLPAAFRGAAREAAALPGSRKAADIEAGRMRSYAILVDSPVTHWQAPRLAA